MREALGVRLLAHCAVLAAVLSIAFGVFSGVAPTSAYGQGEPRQGVTQDNVKPEAFQYVNVSELVRNGYTVAGPYYVTSVSRKSLVLYTGIEKHDIEMDLERKKVTVRDTTGKSAGFGRVKAKSRVIVCTKATEVLIYVLPAKEERKDE